MTPFLHALFDNSFLQMALWASFLASISSGIIGSYVVVRRIASIAGCISHTVLGGMGVSLWLQRTLHIEWMHPMLGAFVAAILSALLLGWIQLKFRQREDSLIAAIWSTGMAIGVIFISLTPGSTSELMNFLFGNILWVSFSDLLSLAALDLLVLVLVLIYYRPLLALCFDEEQAKLQKVRVQSLYFLLLCLIALSIVLLIQIIGTVLVLALLTIPATISSLLCQRLGPMMVIACLLSGIFSLIGLELAYDFNWPPGATIALTAATTYALILLVKGKIFLPNIPK
jgi:zinc transport system permease protein